MAGLGVQGIGTGPACVGKIVQRTGMTEHTSLLLGYYRDYYFCFYFYYYYYYYCVL